MAMVGLTLAWSPPKRRAPRRAAPAPAPALSTAAVSPRPTQPSLFPGLRSVSPSKAPVKVVYIGPTYAGKTVAEWFDLWPSLSSHRGASVALRAAPAAEVVPKALAVLRTPGAPGRVELVEYLRALGKLDSAQAAVLVSLAGDSDRRVSRIAAQTLCDCTRGTPPPPQRYDLAGYPDDRKVPPFGYARALFLERAQQRDDRRPSAKVSAQERQALALARLPSPRRAPLSVAELQANRAAVVSHLSRLMQQLSRCDSWVEVELVAAVVATGPPGISALDQALRKGNRQSALRLIRALNRYPAIEGALQATWTAWLTDADARRRSWAVSRILRSGVVDDALLDKVRAMLASSDESAQAVATDLAGRMPGIAAAVAPALRGTLPAGSSGVRRMVAGVLGKLGSPARPALPELQQVVFTDLEIFTRSAAFRAIGRIGHMDKSVWNTLARGVEDPAIQPQEAAITAMGDIGRPAVPLLLWCLSHKRSEIVVLAARELARVSGAARGAAPGLRAALVAALANPAASLSALRALEAIGMPDEQLLAHAGGMLTAPSYLHRRAALEFAAALGPRAQPMLPALLACTRDTRASLRAVAGWSAARVAPADPAVTVALRSLLIDPDGEARTGAIVALCEMGPQALAFLPDLVASCDSRPVRFAREGLGADWVLLQSDRAAARGALADLLADPALPASRRTIALTWLARLSKR